MYEHAVYSVISPEGCASILWRSADHARDAAEALRLTANDMATLGVIDQIVAEPLGAAHRDPEKAIDNLGEALKNSCAGSTVSRVSSWSTSDRKNIWRSVTRASPDHFIMAA